MVDSTHKVSVMRSLDYSIVLQTVGMIADAMTLTWLHCYETVGDFLIHHTFPCGNQVYRTNHDALILAVTRVRFLSLAWSKLKLCSGNHRPDYWSDLPCDWLITAWAYPEQETENGPWTSAAALNNYKDVIMGAMASQITSLTIVYSNVHSGADKKYHQSSASLQMASNAEMFPFDDVIMKEVSDERKCLYFDSNQNKGSSWRQVSIGVGNGLAQNK